MTIAPRDHHGVVARQFDVSQFDTKKPKPAEKPIPKEAIKAASEAARFTSREPGAPDSKKSAKKLSSRQYRTGRNIQALGPSQESNDDLWQLAMVLPNSV